jgi:hypothetical protein
MLLEVVIHSVVLLLLIGWLMAGKKDTSAVQRPGCYGTYTFLHPHICAERGCGDCPFHCECYEESPYHRTNPA